MDTIKVCELHKAHVRGSKRKARDRIVPVSLANQRVLLQWALRHAYGVGGLMFSKWPNVRHEVNRACDAVGIPRCSPNDWRRTYGTWLRAEGIKPQRIGAAMGHVDFRMVERVYGRLTPDALQTSVVRRLDRLDTRPDAVRRMYGSSDHSGGSEGTPEKAAPSKHQ